MTRESLHGDVRTLVTKVTWAPVTISGYPTEGSIVVQPPLPGSMRGSCGTSIRDYMKGISICVKGDNAMVDLDVYPTDDAAFCCDEYSTAVLREVRPVRFRVRDGESAHRVFGATGTLPIRFLDQTAEVAGTLTDDPAIGMRGCAILVPR